MKKILSSLLVLTLALGCGAPCFAYRGDFTHKTHCLKGILKEGLNILNCASSKAKNKMDELKYRQINGLFSDGLACFDEFNAKKEYDLKKLIKKLIKKVLAVSHPDNFKAENKTIYDEYYKQIYHLMANADDCLRRGDCDSYPSFTC